MACSYLLVSVSVVDWDNISVDRWVVAGIQVRELDRCFGDAPREILGVRVSTCLR